MARPDGPYLVPPGLSLQIDATEGLLGNDEDDEELIAREEDRTSTHGGVVHIRADGSFSYFPPATLPYGTDHFEYTVVDARGAEATASVRVVVQAVDGVVALDALGSKGQRWSGVAAEDRAGHDVAGVGDVNGDGFDDLVVVSTRTEDMSTVAETYLVYGGPGLSSADLADADVRFHGTEGLHPTVAAAGDVDGDGLADLLIGDYEARGLAGDTYLILGSTELPADYPLDAAPVILRGSVAGDRSGIGLAGAGDVDGDGFDDVLIGADLAAPNGVDPTGEAYLILGANNLGPEIELASADVRLPGIAAGDQAGRAVAIVGDVDGDGFDDLLIGAPLADPVGRNRAGEAYLVRGASTMPPVLSLADADVRYLGVDANDRAGISVAAAGDVNGDDRADLLIGAFAAGLAGEEAGAAYVVLGRAVLDSTMDLADADVRLEGLADGDAAGLSVSSAGDFDADGYDDLLVGAQGARVGAMVNVGEAYLLLGRSEPAQIPGLGHAALRLQGSNPSDRAGVAVRAAGDVDGDGFADLLVGADRLDVEDQANVGAVFVVLGDDLRANVAGLGGGADDELEAHGGPVSDALVAGRGNDVLISDGGIDVLRGGAGDDLHRIADDRFFRLDGGLGYDTLELGEDVELDLSRTQDLRVRGIERVRLSRGGGSRLTLSDDRASRLSPTTNILAIDGEEDDDVVLDGSWFGPTPEAGLGLDIYVSTRTTAVVHIDPRVQVEMLPPC